MHTFGKFGINESAQNLNFDAFENKSGQVKVTIERNTFSVNTFYYEIFSSINISFISFGKLIVLNCCELNR